MHVELLDVLRCPAPHDESPLIATAGTTVDRRIIQGVLGCPACGAEYSIEGGVIAVGGDVPVPVPARDFPGHERVVRLAALLGLDERGGVYFLDLVSALLVAGLAELAPAARFVVFSASGAPDDDDAGPRADVVLRGRLGAIPLATGCARGVAIDDADPARLRSAVRVLAPRGRLVAPADARVPGGITELARDGEQWVGEREAEPVVSGLRRAPRSG